MIVRWGSKTGTLECQFLATGAGNVDASRWLVILILMKAMMLMMVMVMGW